MAKPWGRVRQAFKAIGGAATAGAAIAAGAGRPWLALGLSTLGYLLPLAVDLRRDRWTPEEIEAHRAKQRQRSTTRQNPILRMQAWWPW